MKVKVLILPTLQYIDNQNTKKVVRNLVREEKIIAVMFNGQGSMFHLVSGIRYPASGIIAVMFNGQGSNFHLV